MADLRDIMAGIHAQRGALTPPLVVAEATPEDHPLHDRFEWDDTLAGPRYREHQAAQLIRSVRVRYAVTEDGREKSVRAFLPVRRNADDDLDGITSSYEPVEAVMADPFRARVVLQEFDREWRAFRARYGHLEEFRLALIGEVGGDG